MFIYEQEAKRLFTLQELELLEGPPDPAFDRVTLLAATLLGVPAVGISLVDSTSAWGNGGTGIGWRGAVPREGSIAGRVVDSGNVVRVEDLSCDAALQHHPLVQDFGMRSALAVPLVLANGVIPGAVVALDAVPRRFTEEDVHQIELVRDVVVGLLEERLRVPTVRRTELEALHAAFDATEMGIAIAVLDSDRSAPRLVYVNDAILHLSGCSRADILTGRARFFDDPVNAELAARLAAAMRREEHQAFPACISRKGETKHWDVRVTPIGTYDGQTRFILLLTDVTRDRVLELQLDRQRKARDESDRLVGALFAEMSDFLIIADAKKPSEGGPVTMFANASFAGYLGVDAPSLEGEPVFAYLDGSVEEHTRQSLLSKFEHYLPIASEVPVRRADGTIGWVSGTANIIRDDSGTPTHWLLVGRDVTMRKEQYQETSEFLTALDSADEPIVIYQVTKLGAFERSYANRAATESNAYALEDFLDELDEQRREALLEHLRGGTHFKTLIRRAEGPSAGWLSLDLRPSLNYDMNMHSVIAIEHRLELRRRADVNALAVAVMLATEIRSFASLEERTAAFHHVLSVEWNATAFAGTERTAHRVDIDIPARRATANAPRGLLQAEPTSVHIEWLGDLDAHATTVLRVFLERLFIEQYDPLVAEPNG